MNNKNYIIPKERIFEGQVDEAQILISNLIKKAKKSIVLIDGHTDASVLTLLNQRKKNVVATILTEKIPKKLQIALEKHNSQYPKIEAKQFVGSDSIFLIIDDKEAYCFGSTPLKIFPIDLCVFYTLTEDVALELINRVKSL